MTVLFISDLHLQEERPEITRAFLRFLEQKAPTAEQLYILGDLFEYWIGDDAATPFQNEMKLALKQAAQHCSLFFIHGNRDFLIGSEFADQTEATLLNDLTILQLFGRPTLILHGDTLCTLDQEYLTLRKQLRDHRWQQQFLAKSIAERKAFAEALRAESHNAGQNKDALITDVTPEEVPKVMQAHQCNLMIHGHTHRPAVHSVELGSAEAGSRMVLGDWGETGWYIEATPEQVSLKEFAPGSQHHPGTPL